MDEVLSGLGDGDGVIAEEGDDVLYGELELRVGFAKGLKHIAFIDVIHYW